MNYDLREFGLRRLIHCIVSAPKNTFVTVGEARADVNSRVRTADFPDVDARVDEGLVRQFQEEPELRVGLLRLDSRHLEEEVVEEVLVPQQPLALRQVAAEPLRRRPRNCSRNVKG